jgi:hypothetical protein
MDADQQERPNLSSSCQSQQQPTPATCDIPPLSRHSSSSSMLLFLRHPHPLLPSLHIRRCLQMSSRLSELASRSEALTREVATFNAQAVAARGLASAEETRATAAGAEAQALKVGPPCQQACAVCDWVPPPWPTIFVLGLSVARLPVGTVYRVDNPVTAGCCYAYRQ